MSRTGECPICKSHYWYIQYVVGHGEVRPIFCTHSFHDRRGRGWPKS